MIGTLEAKHTWLANSLHEYSQPAFAILRISSRKTPECFVPSCCPLQGGSWAQPGVGVRVTVHGPHQCLRCTTQIVCFVRGQVKWGRRRAKGGWREMW